MANGKFVLTVKAALPTGQPAKDELERLKERFRKVLAAEFDIELDEPIEIKMVADKPKKKNVTG